MLGFLLRLLPFWVREPLYVVIGSVFGVRLMYLAVRDHDWVPAGIGAVFLVFTAIRIHTMVRVLRARRDPDTPAPAPAVGTAAAAAPQVQAPAPVTAEKEPNAWGQAVAAVAVFGAIGAVLWLGPHLLPSDDATQRAASCPGPGHEELPQVYRKTSRPVTGDQLCKALNRPDLARLLGTPGETATTASGNSDTAALTDGKVAEPEAEIGFDTYTVNLSATYNHLSVAQYVKLKQIGNEPNVETRTVLGRPAVFSSDHTMKLEFRLGSGGSSGGPVEEGPMARTLTVALDGKDRGGYYDLTVWSQTGALPDDSALVDIAEKVLPTIPERGAR
ncbi:hypothetical protein FB563_0840 [Streptomyces puniciscabiei]|uniref:Uncharacterized protein n=1 Tax=Streptomyces puniciscabiei TaxID=164348 RepID=A0A542UA23_9ACTN|nr:DUF6215 domain-containing protein [Streptomyces puniciscabiei]TQK95917.1 hypothetical protein FB563_0840 [Streptomyces puniciscabiei]